VTYMVEKNKLVTWEIHCINKFVNYIQAK